MKPAYAVTVLLVLLILSTGCASFVPNLVPTPAPTQKPVVTTTQKPAVNITIKPTTVNATATPTLTITTPPKTIPTTAVSVEPTYAGYYYLPETPDPSTTVTITVAELDAKKEWTAYADGYFKVDYPSNWTITRGYAGDAYSVWLQRESVKYRKYCNEVIFTSPDGRANFTVMISDLSIPGTNNIDFNYKWATDRITPRLLDISGTSVITNYEKKYTTLYKTPYIQYDVTVPERSAYYPYAYTERDVASYSHLYTVLFNTDGNLSEWQQVKTRMFATLQTEELVRVS